ncbi:MAG: GNAT family N-acetyltransferase [Ignavibacteriae bacterium]|nr:GNAT family N-acetyltransferase [Ignavibacteriota bacterium]
MNTISIHEIKSKRIKEYKKFLTIGLIDDEENFRITPNDDSNAHFPTKDTADSFTLGAYISGNLAGVVSFTRDGIDREKLRHKGILFRMYVSKNHRGNGIGKLLIEGLLYRVKTLGNIEQINLTVVSNNNNAKSLYEKFGFRTFGVETNAIKWNGKYFDEEQMVLMLK